MKKSDSWSVVILQSFNPIKTLRVEKRTLLILGIGGICFAVFLAFFAYHYFSFFHENHRLMAEVKQLRGQVFALQQKMSRFAAETLPPLKINDLQVIRQPNRAGFAARFWLVSADSRGAPFSGTLAMVAKNDSLRPPVYQVIPEMPLNKGAPQQPGKGTPFEVKGKKFVEAFFDGSSGEVFHTLTVFIYSREGKLILQKSTEIPKP
jgi:hypothetical protein